MPPSSNPVDGPEVTVATAEVSRFVEIAPLVLGIIGLLVVTLMPAVNDRVSLIALCWIAGFSLIAYAVGVATRRLSYFDVTSRRVLARTGVVRRHYIDTTLTQVADVTVERDVLGSIFGYGTLVVREVSGNRQVFKHVAHPHDFCRTVDTRVHAAAR